MRSPVSDERRALWRKQRDFISEWGRPYLSE